jgi:RNA polymerase sigma-70 factor, ECF subfamily
MTQTPPAPPPLPDEALVARVREGDLSAFEEVMRRHNQRLYRVARAIVKDEHEAEDVMQQAYVNAFVHIGQFSGRSQLSTWLTRITIHEAIRRLRTRQAAASSEPIETAMSHTASELPTPERLAYAAELRSLLEASSDALPEAYRIVFVCREVEGLSTGETADVLDVGEEAVKTRLHRARAMLRRELFTRAGSASVEAFAFYRPRCDALVRRVLEQLGARPH